MRDKKSFLAGVLSSALVLLLIGFGMRFIEGQKNASDKKMEAIETLIHRVYKGKVQEDRLRDGLYKGYVEGLGDPYSVYYNEEETKEFEEMTSGEFSGIGALLNQDPKTKAISLVQVYEGYPADKAGLKAEDILLEVDKQRLDGMELAKAITLIKGERGSQVELKFYRPSEEKEMTVTVTRDLVQVETVRSKMLEGNVGYIQITEFDAVTGEQYEKALSDLEKSGMERLIVDLRGNPGGSLEVVCEILDRMLPKGRIVYMEDKNGRRSEETSDEAHQFKKPMAVLVDENSASASEIYAGAIQDYGLGNIVGRRTYGKGVVQQIFDLKDGSSLKLTVANYFTPKGRNINGKGISPDIKVTEEDLKQAENEEDITRIWIETALKYM